VSCPAPAPSALLRGRAPPYLLSRFRGPAQTICRESPLFGLIPSTRMFALLRRGRLRRLNAGDPVFTRGEYTHSLHAIIEGEVGLHLDSGEVLRIVCGGFFGEIEALYGGRRRAAAIAKTGCLLLELDRAIIPSL